MHRRLAFAAFALLGFGLSVAACANPESERAAREAAQAKQDSEDDAKCRSNGVEAGSQAYINCRAQLAEARAGEDAARTQRRTALQPMIGAGTETYSGH
jgi:hypothetical protein